MAIVASVAAGDVGQILAGGYGTVMAGCASAYDLSVINGHHWREDVGGMAVFTDV